MILTREVAMRRVGLIGGGLTLGDSGGCRYLVK